MLKWWPKWYSVNLPCLLAWDVQYLFVRSGTAYLFVLKNSPKVAIPIGKIFVLHIFIFIFFPFEEVVLVCHHWVCIPCKEYLLFMEQLCPLFQVLCVVDQLCFAVLVCKRRETFPKLNFCPFKRSLCSSVKDMEVCECGWSVVPHLQEHYFYFAKRIAVQKDCCCYYPNGATKCVKNRNLP